MRKDFLGLMIGGVMTIASVMTATAVTRPELETRPVGFAGMTGTYGVPVCENGDFVAPSTKYKVVTVKSDAELKTALGTKSGQIIMMEAGTYSGVSLSGYTDYSIIGKNGVKFTSTLKISGESKNILIRNVSVIGYSGDGMDITGNATNIWIDHCTIGWETTSSSKESPDGAMDITSNGVSYITLSWNKYMNTWKTMLHGSGDSDGTDYSNPKRHITHYCNYYYNTDQRTPRIRGGKTHILNCLYENSGWERPNSMTAEEHKWAVKDHLIDRSGKNNTSEYVEDRLINAIGYGVMAAKQADVVVESCHFYDVRWPIVASRPCEEFRERYGDLQSPDINNGCLTSNNGNGGCYAVRQIGNTYSDEGLTNTIEVKTKPEPYDETTNPMQVVALDYSYTDANGHTQYVIRPEMLNPGKRSIKFDEYNAANAFSPESYSGYYPTGYTKRDAGDVHELVLAYAGADAYTIACNLEAPTLTHSGGDLNQTDVQTIDDIVFTWGGGATDVFVTGVPAANMKKDMTNKTLTISGKVSEMMAYSVTTRGGSGDAVSYSGTIYPTGYSASCGKMARIEVDIKAAGTYDVNIYDASDNVIKTVYSGSMGIGKMSLIFAATDIEGGEYTWKLVNTDTNKVAETGTVTIP